MKKLIAAAALAIGSLAAAPAMGQTPPAAAAAREPQYVTIKMQIDVNGPAAQVWAKVGGYCMIKDWLTPNCVIISGDGGIGTVRSFNPPANTSVEVLTAITPLSYGYTQPLNPARPYNLYHGFLEARAKDATHTTLYYTLMYDVSMLADQAAKDADVARRRAAFEAALGRMKDIAEGRPVVRPTPQPGPVQGAVPTPTPSPR
jgi:hypothetical protein